ncbi:MAG: chitobiase/beta-hexosaminidase C-terminal domain-containing protein [Bacteroidales bacterium]|nr:chitobiase/beta-hexosaminidase C-terminal domain-containing protein [Bacteroidales bacterium]
MALGDKVQAYGKKTVYSGLIELTSINGSEASQFSTISTGNTLPLAEKTIAEILADHAGTQMLQSTRVKIVDAIIGTINTGSNTTLTQGENTLNIYKIPALDSISEGDAVDVIGVVGCHTNPQLRVAYAADVTIHETPAQPVATPTFSPVAGTYTEAQNVTISTTTEGATIYYTLDGTDPTTASSVYSTAIAVNETTTIKAIGVKEGMLNSDIASATYTIETPTPPTPTETSYKLITNANALVAGDKYIIVGIKGETYKALGKQATNNRPAVTVTPSNDTITVTPASEAGADGVYELTLGQEDGKWTLYDAVNGGYLYAASSSKNYLMTQTENNANGQWTIEIASSGVATIKAQGTNTRNWIRLNSNGTPFSCYASGQMDVYLYKAGDVPTPSTYNVTVASGITNGTVSVNPTSGAAGTTITVTATPSSGYELATLTYTYGSTTVDIDQTSMQFQLPEADVTVNATFTEIASVATPTFSPAAGMYISAQTVSLACATEGATIYYTTDGTEPTTASTVYANPFTVGMTTTVKAFAAKQGMNNSAIASAEYTMIEVMTIAAARSLENNEYALVQGVVTFLDGRNVFIQDATGGIDLYLNNNTVPTTLALGDMVKGYGKKTVYGGLVELTSINGNNENQFLVLSSGNPLPLAIKTIAEIIEDYNGSNALQGTRVKVEDAIIGAINTSGNTLISQGDNSIIIYKIPTVEGLVEGDIVTVTSVIGAFNNVLQLRVGSASDVTYEHPIYPTLTGAPTELTGFSYQYGEGPSATKSFVMNGAHLTSTVSVNPSANYEISLSDAPNFVAMNKINMTPSASGVINNVTVYVRLKAGLEIDTYQETMFMSSAETDTVYISLSGSVTEPLQPSDYTRISDLSELSNGAKVVFAARYNEVANEYFAMTAQASGKPTGVLFTSLTSATGETLPTIISDEEDTYYWTVATDGTNYTFTNANGDVLGYTSGTNFATGGDNTAWNITFETSSEGAMVPNYSGFVVTNGNSTARAFALNSQHNFGPYAKQNMGGSGYNFYIDMFVMDGGGTPVCASPTFSPEGGTYYEVQTVAIACATTDATIYYTLDGTEPDQNSAVYSEPITVAESMTIKAIAMMEGYENSNVATAEYIIILGAVTIFEQDWEGEMNGWTFVTVEGNKPWTIGQNSGNHYANANGYNDNVNNEQWCISPAFDLNTYSNASLTFRNAKNYTGPDMQLFFSSNYDGNPATATWTELTFEKSTGSYAWTESGIIDLANFTGDECYIGFKYTSTPEANSAAAWEVDDVTLIGFTTDPYLTVTPNALSGFNYVVGNGPSAAQTFTVSGGNLPPAPGSSTGGVTITCSNTHYEFSLDGTEYWHSLTIEVVGTLEPTTVYVRLEDDLTVGQWDGVVTLEDGGTTATVTVSGTVTEEPTPGDSWNRILSLSDLSNGDQLIIAARYDATVGDGYYAMTAGVSGKPEGVLFTSEYEGGVETLPEEIANNADTYLWNVVLNGSIITLVNAAGDTLGYNSSTNFSGNVNTEWNIALETAGDNAMVPGYTGFVITNVETTTRGVALNSSHNYGAYSTTNINNDSYNFYVDLFVQGGSSTPTVATPVFSMASGTYYEEIDVEIECATEDAMIFYTTDGSDPTSMAMLYMDPIHVDADMTIKAIAIKEGFENSAIATANYVIMSDVVIVFEQDWEGEMNGWSFVTIEGNKPWLIGEHNGNHYANANGYGDDTDNEQWCISPDFNLTQYAGQNVILMFMNAMKFNGPDMEVMFTNDYDGADPTAATWYPLSYNMSPGNYEWVESGMISLNAFSGAICHIGFRYTSTLDDGAASWEIDDIMLMVDMGTDPYLSATPNALSGFTHTVGYGPSEAQTFVLTGGNLPPMPGSTASGITISCDNPAYELSLDGIEYYPYLGIITEDGTLEPTSIYVRLNGEEAGEYNGIITIEDEVLAVVSVSGHVTEDGIGETLANSVNVWNNVNELMIANNSDSNLDMVVYNIAGQPVIKQIVATGNNVIRHDLAQGVYVVRLTNGKEMKGVKVLVRP